MNHSCLASVLWLVAPIWLSYRLNKVVDRTTCTGVAGPYVKCECLHVGHSSQPDKVSGVALCYEFILR